MISLTEFTNDLFQFIILKMQLLIRKSVDTNCRFHVKTCIVKFRTNTTNRYYIMSVTSHCKGVFFLFPLKTLPAIKSYQVRWYWCRFTWSSWSSLSVFGFELWKKSCINIWRHSCRKPPPSFSFQTETCAILITCFYMDHGKSHIVVRNVYKINI